MKVSKIFGFVLFFHFGVIGLLIVQPGCRTTQPPTETHQQRGTISRGGGGDLIPATRVEGSLDPSFNSGFQGEEGRYVPSRPGDFSEFDGIAPLDPIAPTPTIDIAGPAFETYSVKKGDSLWSISKRYSVSLSELYSANGLNKNSVLKIGQQIQIPVDGSTASVATVTPDTYQPSGYNTEGQSYVVKAGDNLSRIARNFNTTVGAIKAANGKSSDIIRVGEKLIIPVSSGSSSPRSTPKPTTAVSPSRGNGVHVVKAGEYPGTIAEKYGMTATELLVLNNVTDPRSLQIGQRLKVSGSGTAANIDTKTETFTAAAPAPVAASTSVPAAPARSTGPVEIRVVEADPLVEGETDEIDTDALFESAVEIPVIRLDE